MPPHPPFGNVRVTLRKTSNVKHFLKTEVTLLFWAGIVI